MWNCLILTQPSYVLQSSKEHKLFIQTGRASVWNYPFSDAGCDLQQNWQHQSPHDSTRLQCVLQRRISPLEKILVELQSGLQPARIHSRHKPKHLRTNDHHRHGQQRVLPGLDLSDLLGFLRRVQQLVLQHNQRFVAGLGTVCVHFQSSLFCRHFIPARRHGAPVRILVQVRLSLHHFGRCGKWGVHVVGRAHKPGLVARSAKSSWHFAKFAALRDPPSHPFPAQRLQPGLFQPHALRVQLHRHQPHRIPPPVHQPTPVDAGGIQNCDSHLHGRVGHECHDIRRQLWHRDFIQILQEILRAGHMRLPELPRG